MNDPLHIECVAFYEANDYKATARQIMDKFGIGYNHACRLIEDVEMDLGLIPNAPF